MASIHNEFEVSRPSIKEGSMVFMDDYFDAQHNIEQLHEPKSTIHDFEVIKVLESGAFGVVKLARHKPYNFLVALKEVNTAYLQKVDKLRHLQREQQLLKVLNHQHIVKLFESFDGCDEVSSPSLI